MKITLPEGANPTEKCTEEVDHNAQLAMIDHYQNGVPMTAEHH
jgi:hypothetical protein